MDNQYVKTHVAYCVGLYARAPPVGSCQSCNYVLWPCGTHQIYCVAYCVASYCVATYAKRLYGTKPHSQKFGKKAKWSINDHLLCTFVHIYGRNYCSFEFFLVNICYVIIKNFINHTLFGFFTYFCVFVNFA